MDAKFRLFYWFKMFYVCVSPCLYVFIIFSRVSFTFMLCKSLQIIIFIFLLLSNSKFLNVKKCVFLTFLPYTREISYSFSNLKNIWYAKRFSALLKWIYLPNYYGYLWIYLKVWFRQAFHLFDLHLKALVYVKSFIFVLVYRLLEGP